jgi:DNA-binding beta-propeller fold protein YncE
VSVISDATNTVVFTVQVGEDPSSIAYNTDENCIYVTNTLQGTISIISLGNACTPGHAPPSPSESSNLLATEIFIVIIAGVSLAVVASAAAAVYTRRRRRTKSVPVPAQPSEPEVPMPIPPEPPHLPPV